MLETEIKKLTAAIEHMGEKIDTLIQLQSTAITLSSKSAEEIVAEPVEQVVEEAIAETQPEKPAVVEPVEPPKEDLNVYYKEEDDQVLVGEIKTGDTFGINGPAMKVADYWQQLHQPIEPGTPNKATEGQGLLTTFLADYTSTHNDPAHTMEFMKHYGFEDALEATPEQALACAVEIAKRVGTYEAYNQPKTVEV